MIRRVIDFFEKCQFDKSLRDKQIVVVDDEVFWVERNWSDFGKQISVLKVADQHRKGIGQYTLIVIPALWDVVEEIWNVAEESTVINMEYFRRRAKDEPGIFA